MKVAVVGETTIRWTFDVVIARASPNSAAAAIGPSVSLQEASSAASTSGDRSSESRFVSLDRYRIECTPGVGQWSLRMAGLRKSLQPSPVG